jgi:undecaprenyl diphosphate synthase
MDGNGRYATKRGFIRSMGHKMGASALRKIVHHCYDIGVESLTVFAFSTENWKRPQEEIDALMHLLSQYLRNYEEELGGRDIRINPMGDITRFSEELQNEMANVREATKNAKRMVFNVCLNYGGRAEIVHAASELSKSNQEFTEENFANHLYGLNNREIDLIIRTSGEMRLSNFLLWQSAYAEFWVTKKTFPEFGTKDMAKAIKHYGKRHRRFGGL